MLALRRVLPRRYYLVEAEHALTQEPLRLDVVVVRQRRAPLTFRPQALSDLVEMLGEHTLVEFKGPRARLRRRSP